jgi:hypothetical protein
MWATILVNLHPQGREFVENRQCSAQRTKVLAPKPFDKHGRNHKRE